MFEVLLMIKQIYSPLQHKTSFKQIISNFFEYYTTKQ